MAAVKIPFSILYQVLEERCALAGALAFSEVSRLGGRRAVLRRQLQRNVRQLVVEQPLVALHRRHLGGAPVVGSVTLELEPPARDAAWRVPLPLVFPVLRWQHHGETCLAYVPALDIVVAAPTPAELSRRLPAEIRAALQRRETVPTLRGLVAVQRVRRLLVEPATVSVRVPSAKERVTAAERTQEKKPSVLAQVATDLTQANAEPAYGLEPLVEQLAELLTTRPPRSVLLIGPSGVGKTAVVRELVRCRAAVQLGATPFFATSGARLVAGMMGYGMWQQRCQEVVREASQKRAVLHLGNLVELVEVGRSAHNQIGIAAFLRPALARGTLLAVAECTPEEAAALERESPQLLDAFQRLPVPEPTVAQGQAILRHVAARLALGRTPPLADDALTELDRLHRRYATYSAYPGRPLRFLRHLLQDGQGAAPVTAAAVLAAFARETGLPRLLLDPAERLDLAATRRWFGERVRGQDEAIDLVVDLLALTKAGLSRPRKPIASLLFIGPTGVGKTELAKALAEFLFGSPRRLTRFDMSEYADPVAVGRLVGGVFGSEGLLTAKVREQPFSVVLLDEFEKAHPQLGDVLLQVLGEGRLTDAAGRVADFTNTVVILTSNLGAESFQHGGFGFAGQPTANEPARRSAARAHFTRAVQAFLRPELYNRLDRLVPFAPLAAETIARIAASYLHRVEERDGIRYRGTAVTWGDGVAAHLGSAGFDIRYGARPLLRAVERELLAPLADQMNRYSSETPLTVTVGLAANRLDIAVKARTNGTGTAGTAPLLEAVQPCVELRRLVQALDRCRSVRELRNELHQLEAEQQRWEKARTRYLAMLARLTNAPEEVKQRLQRREPRGQAAEAARLAKLVRLREVAGQLAALGERVRTLEEQALESLYARRGEGLDPADLAAAVQPQLAALDELLLQFFCRDFPRPDDLTLVIYSEQPDLLTQLAWAYRDAARRHGLAVTTLVYLLPPRGKLVPPAEKDEESTAEPPPRSWRKDTLIVPPAGRQPERAVLVREQVRDIDALLAEPPAGLLGVNLAMHGRAATPRFTSEAGLHVFPAAPPQPAGMCLVETSELPPEAYLPPVAIARRGAIGSQDRRRTYDRANDLLDDALLGQRLAGQSRPLRDVLAAAVEGLLQRRLVGLLEE